MKNRIIPAKFAYNTNGIGVFSNAPLDSKDLDDCEHAAAKHGVKVVYVFKGDK